MAVCKINFPRSCHTASGHLADAVRCSPPPLHTLFTPSSRHHPPPTLQPLIDASRGVTVDAVFHHNDDVIHGILSGDYVVALLRSVDCLAATCWLPCCDLWIALLRSVDCLVAICGLPCCDLLIALLRSVDCFVAIC